MISEDLFFTPFLLEGFTDGETIFCFSCDIRNLSKLDLQVLKNLLSQTEIERCSRFRHNDDAIRFSVGRGILRTWSGKLLNCSPQSVPVRVNQAGKPSLVGSDIEVTISHSGNIVLVAFSYGFPIGIDVEEIEPSVQGTAAVHCAETAQFYHIVANPCAELDFFRTWTQIEAILKMYGRGFLDDIAFCQTYKTALNSLVSENDGPLTLMNVPVADGYVGALACMEKAVHINWYDLTRSSRRSGALFPVSDR